MNDIKNAIEIVGAGGGKKGGGKAADNTLKSNAVARIVEAISEGPIVGLVKGPQSIYFDETPVKNSDNTWNFDNVTWQQRKGNPDDDHLNGHDAVETVTAVETEIKVATGPVTRTIVNANADAVRIMVRINSLFLVDDKGQAQTNSLDYSVELRPFGGAWTAAVNQSLTNEKCTSPVQIAHRVELPVGGHPWDIRVVRNTPDSIDDKDQKSMTFESYVTLVEGRFTYPHTALVALNLNAENLGQQIPQRAYHVMGRIISVPSNYNPVTRVYTGIWNGTFIQAWTNNPAWVFYDLLINNRYGLGEFINETEVAGLKWQLYTIGQYCDEMIPSGFKDGGAVDILEPRFSFNGVIRNRQEAYHVLQSITTSFRGMGYWALGQVFASADMPADPVKLVTPTNVLGGGFNYSSTAKKARHSVVIVSWNDPNDFYRPATEMVINNKALQKNGWREKRVDFPGCSSRGLAHRYGKWILDVEHAETETVIYKASFDHMDIAPGEIVSIADPRKATVRMGGRVFDHFDFDGTDDHIKLDAEVAFSVGENYKIWITKDDGNLVELPIKWINPTKDVVAVTGQTFKVSVNSVFIITGSDVVPQQYRVLSITETEENVFQITGLFHDPDKYARIEQGVSFDPKPYSRDGIARKVQNLTADEIAYVDASGSPRTKARLTWQAPNGVVVREYVVQVDTPTEVKKFVTSTRNTSVDIENLERGDHIFYVTVIDRKGRTSMPEAVAMTVTATDSISAGSVENLLLVDANGSTEFFGRDVRIQWENLFPTVTGGVATTPNPTLYEFNTVEVFHHPSNTLLRSVRVEGNTFTYSFDHNERDTAVTAGLTGPARSLRFEVKLTSKTGNVSLKKTLAVSNPVPTASVPTIDISGSTISVSLPSSADTDIRGMKVWIEGNNTYDPLVTTPKYDGPGGFMNWIGAPGTNYYIRAGYRDFFDDTMNVSAVVAVTTDSIVTPVAPAIPTGLALTTALLPNGMARVTAVWNANAEVDLSHYELSVAENAGNSVTFRTSTTTKFWDVISGTSLAIKIRAHSTSSLFSAYSTTKTKTAAADAVAPALPTGASVIGSFEGFWVSWVAVADLDLDHYDVYRGDVSTRPLISATPTFATIDTNLYDGGYTGVVTRYYWIRSVDTSDNKSAWTAVQSASTILVGSGAVAPGAIIASHVSTNEIITNTANIAMAVITGANIANATIVNANIANATITSAKINSVEADKIVVSGGTTLSDWRMGGDETHINGGEVSANTISANKLTIGQRGISTSEIVFSTDANTASWTAGLIHYADDTGTYVDAIIASGSIAWTSVPYYIYWVKGETLLRRTINRTTATGPTKVIVAIYDGGTKLSTAIGMTIIDGDHIKTGAITADHIAAGIINAGHVGANTITATHIAAATITAAEIAAGAITAAEIAAGAITTETLAVGLGVQRLGNSDFRNGSYGWTVSVAGTLHTPEITHGLRIPGTTYSGGNFPTYMIQQLGMATDGFADLFYNSEITEGDKIYGEPVQPGQWVEISAKVALLNCNCHLYIQWLDENGDHISWSPSVGWAVDTNALGDNPESWPTVWGKSQAPAGAAYAGWRIRKQYTNTGGSSWMFVHHPQQVITHEYSTTPVPWSIGGTTLITGSMIRTGTISAGMGIFSGPLKSTNFITGSTGWLIDSNGSAELNNLIIRGSVQVGAVSDGVTYVNNSGIQRDNGSDAFLKSLGQFTTGQFWQIACRMRWRLRRKTSVAYNNKGGSGVTVTYKRTNITFQVRTQLVSGGSWGSWETEHTFGWSPISNEWMDDDFVISKQGTFNDVQVRAYVSTFDSIIQDPTSTPGVINYNNIDDISLIARALVR